MTISERNNALAWAVKQAREWKGYYSGTEDEADYAHNLRLAEEALQNLKVQQRGKHTALIMKSR